MNIKQTIKKWKTEGSNTLGTEDIPIGSMNKRRKEMKEKPNKRTNIGEWSLTMSLTAAPVFHSNIVSMCSCCQVIIIQPQAPSSTDGSPGAQADLPPQEAPPAPKSPSQKKDEDPEVKEHLPDIKVQQKNSRFFTSVSVWVSKSFGGATKRNHWSVSDWPTLFSLFQQITEIQTLLSGQLRKNLNTNNYWDKLNALIFLCN